MKFLTGMLDRLLFIAAFLLAMQLPQFVNLYQQRLEGYLQASQQQISDFQQMATQQGYSSLTLFSQSLQKKNTPTSRQTAQLITHQQLQTKQLTKASEALNTPSLLAQFWALLRYPQPALLWATANHFTAGVALTLPALICGLIAAFLVMLIKSWGAAIWHYRSHKRYPQGRNPLL